MDNAERFRNFASTCERMAEDLGPDHRERLLDMARAWRELAGEAERLDELIRDVDRAFDDPRPHRLVERPRRSR
jgi:hypothetical protein